MFKHHSEPQHQPACPSLDPPGGACRSPPLILGVGGGDGVGRGAGNFLCHLGLQVWEVGGGRSLVTRSDPRGLAQDSGPAEPENAPPSVCSTDMEKTPPQAGGLPHWGATRALCRLPGMPRALCLPRIWRQKRPSLQIGCGACSLQPLPPGTARCFLPSQTRTHLPVPFPGDGGSWAVSAAPWPRGLTRVRSGVPSASFLGLAGLPLCLFAGWHDHSMWLSIMEGVDDDRTVNLHTVGLHF